MERRKQLLLISFALIPVVATIVWLDLRPGGESGGGNDGLVGVPSGRSDTASGGGARNSKVNEAERDRREAHNEELDRRRAANHEEAMQRMGSVPANAVPVIVSTNVEGTITSSVIDALKLTSDEVSSLKSAIAEQKASEAKDFASRAELTSETQGEFGKTYQYYVRARKDRGKESQNAFAAKIEAAVGAERAKKFIGGMDEFSFFGGAGKYDVDFTFYLNEEGKTLVKYNYRDPSNAKVTRTRETTAATFKGEFGDAFELPDS